MSVRRRGKLVIFVFFALDWLAGIDAVVLNHEDDIESHTDKA